MKRILLQDEDFIGQVLKDRKVKSKNTGHVTSESDSEEKGKGKRNIKHKTPVNLRYEDDTIEIKSPSETTVYVQALKKKKRSSSEDRSIKDLLTSDSESESGS